MLLFVVWHDSPERIKFLTWMLNDNNNTEAQGDTQSPMRRMGARRRRIRMRTRPRKRTHNTTRKTTKGGGSVPRETYGRKRGTAHKHPLGGGKKIEGLLFIH